MAVFELGGALASALPELQVGPWTRAQPDLLAFDADPAQPPSLWRVDLSRNDAASRAALTEGERSVARTHAVLDDLPRRLDRVIEQARDHALEQARDHALEQAPSSQEPSRLAAALASIADLARGRARIETRVEGVLVAHSITTLSGDTELWITPHLSRSGANLHARSVAVATRTRHAWARILTLVVAGCGRLVTFGLPTAGLATLPLVWPLLRDLLREIRDRSPAPRTSSQGS